MAQVTNDALGEKIDAVNYRLAKVENKLDQFSDEAEVKFVAKDTFDLTVKALEMGLSSNREAIGVVNGRRSTMQMLTVVAFLISFIINVLIIYDKFTRP